MVGTQKHDASSVHHLLQACWLSPVRNCQSHTHASGPSRRSRTCSCIRKCTKTYKQQVTLPSIRTATKREDHCGAHATRPWRLQRTLLWWRPLGFPQRQPLLQQLKLDGKAKACNYLAQRLRHLRAEGKYCRLAGKDVFLGIPFEIPRAMLCASFASKVMSCLLPLTPGRPCHVIGCRTWGH